MGTRVATGPTHPSGRAAVRAGAGRRIPPVANLREIQAGKGGALGVAARLGLAAGSAVFGAAAALRRAAFAAGLRARHALPVPVVSVGNLTAGGTGKTPFTVWLARALLAAGKRPGVLSRGYGARAEGSLLSDEGAVRAALLGPSVPQVETPDRVRGGASLLAAHHEIDVLLLDDGFQHLRLRRDLDIVLLDATDPFGRGHLLPRGLLRERPAALARAGAVVISRAERVTAPALAALRARVAALAPDAVVAVARLRPRALLGPKGGESPLSGLRGAAVHAWAGIGNPEAFAGTLRDLGARVVGTTFARDHHRPTDAEMAAVAAAAAAEGADRVVVTLKDLVKLSGRAGLPAGLVAVDVVLEVAEGERELLERVTAALKSPPRPPPPPSSAP